MPMRVASLCVDVVGRSSAPFWSFSPLSFGSSFFTLTGVLGGEARAYSRHKLIHKHCSIYIYIQFQNLETLNNAADNNIRYKYNIL